MSPIARLLGLVLLSCAVAAPAFAANAGSGGIPGLHPLIPVQQATAGKLGDARSSANWAGYAVASPDPTGSPLAFTHVLGTWKVPAITCGANDSSSGSAFWVGLGGFFGNQQVEQIGTWADCASQGPPSYFGWYELAPSLAHSFALKVEPGDTITGSVTVDATNDVTMTLENVTRHDQAAVHTRVAVVDLSSAEWMAEAPSSCSDDFCSVESLPDFGTFAVSNLQATANGQSGTLTDPAWVALPIEIGSSNATTGTCTPTETGTTGSAFSMTWAAAGAANC